jgi:N-acetyl-alpha-D-muramate 1-phosphate uridylyltransferase
MQAMILAAGLGTRFKPWTDSHPKALALVNGKSLLERNIVYLQQFGISEVIVNVHHFADQVIETIKRNHGWKSHITISDESDQVLETGGGLKKASWYFSDAPFVVMNVDILTDLDLATMISFHQSAKPLATLAITDRKTTRYFLFDQHSNLTGWRNIQTKEEKISVEASDTVQKAFSGIHIIDPGIFPLIRETGKFSIVDAYLELARTETIKGFDHSSSKLVDVGRTTSLAEAEKLFP